MSHPQPKLRAFLDDGFHSGQTISIEPAADGKPPERIVVHVPPEGEQVQEISPEHNKEGQSGDDQVDYKLDRADEDLGLWVYRAIES